MLISDALTNNNNFSNAEKAVANQLIELQDNIKDISVRELAKMSYTSTSAVVRLCNKLGFDGYNDFKEKYLEEIAYENAHFDKIDANFPFNKDDNLARVINSISELYQETAKDTMSLVNYYDYIEAVKIMKNSQNIYVLSIGQAFNAGKVFADRMNRIGKNVIVSDNFNEQFYYSYNTLDQDCFIIITYTGTTPRTIRYIDNVAKSKSKLILITSVGENEIKKKADVVLPMTTREKLYTNIATYSTFISTMLILDMLYSCYFQGNFEENLKHKREVAKIYEPLRKATNEVMIED
ncbi:MAG: MurR/RpiR family transcriptional regulator [Erysipelotrichaceae bacterium]|nr:MurR/RpiR family transcriptional regulator [Erysipelotrichaceae bacterium]